MHTTYISYFESIDTYYVDSTSNIDDRLKRHNTGRSTYTKRGIPWIIVYQREYLTNSEAYQSEMYIKSQKSRKYIQDLIAREIV